MSIRDRNISKAAGIANECISASFVTATSQTALAVLKVTPGYAFTVTRVSVFATAVTATVSVDVAIGSTSVLTGVITPVAGAETAGTVVSTSAAIGGHADQLVIKYTTNGTGAMTNPSVTVWIRPHGMEGELKIKG